MPGKKDKIAIKIPEIKMTKAEIQNWMQRMEDARKLKPDPPKEPKDDRVGTCVVCEGKVVAKVTREYRGDPMHMIIGPGSRNQMTTIHHGFHCVTCGLKYEFPPPSRENVKNDPTSPS